MLLPTPFISIWKTDFNHRVFYVKAFKFNGTQLCGNLHAQGKIEDEIYAYQLSGDHQDYTDIAILIYKSLYLQLQCLLKTK